MDYEAKIREWIAEDPGRMRALTLAAGLGLPDWCLAAGFVRNLVWDNVHNFSSPTPLNDIDLIYFDPSDDRDDRDREIEKGLKNSSSFSWSVKNQARMHKRNFDEPYTSTSDAMSYWVEVETAVGAALDDAGEIVLVSPFGFESLFKCTVTMNAQRPKPEEFAKRMSSKQWLEMWPMLVVNA